MVEHPCAGGLTPACFRVYPKWARQALAYKILHILLPKQVTKKLPGILSAPLVAPGVEIPPGVVLPPGTVVPPAVVIPPGYNPGDPAPPGVIIPPGAVFPPGWTPGDPAPPGVIIPPGAVFPPGWTPPDPVPPGVIIPPEVSPTPPDSGGVPPILVQPWEPGPVISPSVRGGVKTKTISIKATQTAWAQNTDADWDTCRNTDSAVTFECESVSSTTSVLASYISGLYAIRRMYNEFSLAGIPSSAIIVSATLSLKLNSGDGKVARAYANIGDFLCSSPDYLDVANIPSDPVTLSLGENIITLSDDAIAVIQSKIGSTCCINTRESSYDYDNVPPLDTEIYEANFYNRLAAAINKPALNITYKT